MKQKRNEVNNWRTFLQPTQPQIITNINLPMSPGHLVWPTNEGWQTSGTWMMEHYFYVYIYIYIFIYRSYTHQLAAAMLSMLFGYGYGQCQIYLFICLLSIKQATTEHYSEKCLFIFIFYFFDCLFTVTVTE